MSPASYARLTRLALWALAVIVVTGSAVRLTGSGLGCSDWPTCEQDSLVAPLEYHALVEFGNRLFTGVVAVAVIAAVLGSWRRLPRRSDLIIWSCGLVVGVVGQVLLGALLVRTELDPRFVMGHFLLSMVLLWNAAVLDVKARTHDVEPVGGAGVPAVSVGSGSGSGGGSGSGSGRLSPTAAKSSGDSGSGSGSDPVSDRWTMLLLRAMFVVGAALLVTGALVTGSGPHAGDTRAERLPLLVREVARIHSVVAIGLLALVVMTWLRQQPVRRDRRLSPLSGSVSDRQRRAAIRCALVAVCGPSGSVRDRLPRVAILLVVQGTIGYAQYFSGVPALLVGIHVAMASVIWIEIVKAAYPAIRLKKSGDAISRVFGDSGDADAGKSDAVSAAMLAARP